MSIRLGELLVLQGMITSDQQQQILDIQKQTGRPFGVIAEEQFGVDPGVIEQAWATQYAMISVRMDPAEHEIDPSVLDLVTKRQAWQFGFIPISRTEYETNLVASKETLARALRFVNWRLPGVCTFAICDLKSLRRGLETHYPLPGADSELLSRFGSKRAA